MTDAKYDRSRAVMTQASRPIDFKRAGLRLMMSPLTDRDIAELDHWVQANYLQTARRGLLTREDEVRLYPACVSRAAMMTWYGGDGLATITSVDGLAQLLYIGCRRNHPELTHETVRKLITTGNGEIDEAQISEFNRVFNELNEMPDHPTVPVQG